MKKRVLAMLLTTAVTVSLVVGCGAGGGEGRISESAAA